MRILVLTNFYPPYYIGGYELACQDVVESLKRHGHHLSVITSTYGLSGSSIDEGHIYRVLLLKRNTPQSSSIGSDVWQHTRNRHKIKSLINVLQPDIVYIWGMNQLELSIPDAFISQIDQLSLFSSIGRSTVSTVFAVSDGWLLGEDDRYQHWFYYWQHTPRHILKRKVKSIIKRCIARSLPIKKPKLSIKYAHFFSHSLQQQYAKVGIIPQEARIIYHGVSLPSSHSYQGKSFTSESEQANVKLLYSGRLDPQKGVHTAIEAVAILKKKEINQVNLDIVGLHESSEYVSHLFDLIEQYNLHDCVFIHKRIPREKLDAVYYAHDVLLFPSIWEEPFSITVLEAMAHGLLVIGTSTGGSAEILRHGENSLVFKAGDAHDLAKQIEYIMSRPESGEGFRRTAFETIRSQFSFETMTQQIETFLHEVYQQHSRTK